MAIAKAGLLFTLWLTLGGAATVGETDRFIPLIQDGAGWSTQVTIVNVSAKPALVVATFLTNKGYAETWKVALKASIGTVSGSTIEATLPPGASTVIETSGEPQSLTRGYADIIEFQEAAFSAYGRLVRRENGAIVQSFTVPILPAHESRSVLPLNIGLTDATPEIIWISPTSSTTLDVNFRRENGETYFSDRVSLDGNSQIFVRLLDLWPQLAGFRGSLEWKVSFPTADRYEYRYLCGLLLLKNNDVTTGVVTSMTLKADQLNTNPYNQ